MSAIYSSKYTDKKVTSAQLLAEKMVERKFSLRNQKLPKHFWNDLKYRKDFLAQKRFADQLLKLYCFEAINNAIMSKDAARTYSLAAKWLDPIIMREQHKIDLDIKAKASKMSDKPKEEINDGPIEFRKDFTKKTLKDLL
jgi:hypothetical protein